MPPNRNSSEYAGRLSSTVTKIDIGSATNPPATPPAREPNSTGSAIPARHASGASRGDLPRVTQRISGFAFGNTLYAPTASDTSTQRQPASAIRTNRALDTGSYSVSRPSVAIAMTNAETNSSAVYAQK